MWPIERMRRTGGLPGPDEIKRSEAEAWALVESGHRGLVVTAADEAARRQGVHVGQVLADARAALPGLRTRPAERSRDLAALARLASWCGRYGPGRNMEGEDGIWIDVTGVAHLFGGEAALLRDLTGRLARFGLTARAGIAETHGVAHALARFGCGPNGWAVAAPGTVEAALAPLPVEALRLDERSVLLLKRLGLRRIGQLHGLPREALARRFRAPDAARSARRSVAQAEAARAAGEVVLRLDQALGMRSEMRRPLAEPPVHLVRESYPDLIVSAAGVEAHCRRLVEALCQALEVAEEGVRRLRLTLYRADGTSVDVLLGTSRPVRDAAHLTALLLDKTAALDAGFGIDMMTIEALEVEPFTGEQVELTAFDAAVSAGVPGELVDRLSNRLGARHVLRFAAAASHLPERAWRLAPALGADADDDRHAACGGAEHAVRVLRPPLLLVRPERIEALATVPDGPPVQFSWRRVRRRVVKAEGPERIAPEWWRRIGMAAGPGMACLFDRTRDYYRLEDETGARYWVFRAGLYRGDCEMEAGGEEDGTRPSWFMHGMFP
ncbi:MAG: hypothetical protein RLZ98_2249 [Pseudomonadota bacterium]|jgi:protein ImuB